MIDKKTDVLNEPAQSADVIEVSGQAESFRDPEAIPEELLAAAEEMPGSHLAARRAELRLSLEEVAAKLKLAPRQVIAIEADDFASLPGMASARGFIRSYAKLLELDPTPLVKMIASEPNPAFEPLVLRRPLPSAGYSGRSFSASGAQRGLSRRTVGIVVIVLAVIAALVFVGRQADWYSLLKIGSIDFSRATTQSSRDAAAALPAVPATSDAITTAAPVPGLVSDASIDSARALEIRLREDSWVEISNLNGVKLVSRMMVAGTSEKFEIKEPLVLVIGNAAGVDAKLRGQILNLRAVARNNVTKLSLK